MARKLTATLQDALRALPQGWVESCPECESTRNEDDQSGFLTCMDCGHFWPEGTAKRRFVAA